MNGPGASQMKWHAGSGMVCLNWHGHQLMYPPICMNSGQNEPALCCRLQLSWTARSCLVQYHMGRRYTSCEMLQASMDQDAAATLDEAPAAPEPAAPAEPDPFNLDALIPDPSQ